MLRDRLIKLAQQVPETRPHLVPLLRRHAAASCANVKGNQRKQHESEVWDMFVKSYQKIGLMLSSPSQLYKYGVWNVCLAGGKPVAFNLFKETSLGLKAGLLGSDGSSDGKSAAVNLIRTRFQKGGVYGEASHKVEAIAVAAGAPAVCSAHVEKVLGKPVDPTGDGVHYSRSISGVGKVTKILLGNPKGVPVTNPKSPSCPVVSGDLPVLSSEDMDEMFDVMVHHACVSFED